MKLFFIPNSRPSTLLPILLFFGLCLSGPVFGEDLRIASQKARSDVEAAQTEARISEKHRTEDKGELEAEILAVQQRVEELARKLADAQKRLDDVQTAAADQNRQQSEEQMDLREYTGVIRETARDLSTILSQSHFTALIPGRLDRMAPVLDTERFPGMAEITALSDLFLEEIALSGEVDIHTGRLIAPDGKETQGTILTLGGFCAVYQTEDDTGFLHYNEATHRFYALSKLPPWWMRRHLNRYMAGDAEDITFDFSKGAALKQLVHRSSLMDKIEKGGPIVWPILGLGLLALLITLERIRFLNRVHANTDRLMGRVNELAGRGDWAACEEVLKHQEGKPVYNVLRAGLGAVHEKRETLESVLQEAILKELPRLERFLPALNIMGAVAPLLGLLGTVTGMIETFQAITLFGAGDPRTMSGGISEALITTMLGLAVAIPIMLVHTFLRRRLEHIVGDMEEKAVALSNIICRECALIPLTPAAEGAARSAAGRHAR